MSNDTAAYFVGWLKKLRDHRSSGDTPRPRRGTLLISSFAPHTRSENRRRLRCATPPLKP